MFEFLTSRQKTDTLGLDIRKNTVKIVKVCQKEGAQASLEICDLIKISQNDSLSQDLRQYLEKNNLLGLTASACLDDKSFKTRTIELPKMPHADLREAIRWKMRDVVDGSVDDYVVRFSSLEESQTEEGKKTTLLGYAILKKSVDNLVKALQKAGLTPVNIEPSAVTLAAAVDLFYPSEGRWVAGVDLDKDRAQMIIIGDGKLYFERHLSGITPPPSENATEGFNQKLAAEIQNALDSFSVNFHVEQIDRLIMSGSTASLPGLTDYLTKNVGIKTEITNPFTDIQIDPAMKEIIEDKPYIYSQAVSLALIKA